MLIYLIVSSLFATNKKVWRAQFVSSCFLSASSLFPDPAQQHLLRVHTQIDRSRSRTNDGRTICWEGALGWCNLCILTTHKHLSNTSSLFIRLAPLLHYLEYLPSMEISTRAQSTLNYLCCHPLHISRLAGQKAVSHWAGGPFRV